MFLSQLGPDQRDSAVSQLATEQFDILVIGGGVTGVACSALPRLPHPAVKVQGSRAVTGEKPRRGTDVVNAGSVGAPGGMVQISCLPLL